MGWIGDVYPQWVWLNNHANDESDPRVFLCRGLAISTCFIPCPTGEESEEGGRLLSCWDLAQDARLAQDASKCTWKRTWGILMDQILPNIFPTIPKTKLSVVQQYRAIRTSSHSKLLANCAIIILIPTIHGHFEGEMIVNSAMKVRMINTSGLIKWFDKTIGYNRK